MTKLFALTLWFLSFALALFTLAADVWAGVHLSVWRFTGAVLLGVTGPSGTWGIAKHHPETSWLAWELLGTTAGVIAVFALLRLVMLLWA